MVKKPNGKRSRTIDFATVVAVLGAIQTTLPGVRDLVPVEWYGPILMVVAVLIAYFRSITTDPLK